MDVSVAAILATVDTERESISTAFTLGRHEHSDNRCSSRESRASPYANPGWQLFSSDHWSHRGKGKVSRAVS